MQQVHGIIAKGMGEGAYFMSMPHYKNEIRRALGFEAYPGTLNIVSKDTFEKKHPLRIEGYQKDGKVFGGANCHLASIENIQGAIIIPDFTKHKKDVLEFIAPVHVKTALKVKDGDKITLKIK